MQINVSVYKAASEDFFSEIPVPRLVFCEKTQLLDYEYLSTICYRSGSDPTLNVDLGQVLQTVSTNSVRALKIYDEVNAEYLWIRETKEQFNSNCLPADPNDDGGDLGNIDEMLASYRKKNPPIYYESVEGGESEIGPYDGLYDIRTLLVVISNSGKTVNPYNGALPVPEGNNFKVHIDNKIYLGYTLMPGDTLTVIR